MENISQAPLVSILWLLLFHLLPNCGVSRCGNILVLLIFSRSQRWQSLDRYGDNSTCCALEVLSDQSLAFSISGNCFSQTPSTVGTIMSNIFPLGQWHHVALVVYELTNLAFYLVFEISM